MTFSGIYPVLYAFYGENGRLSRDLMRKQVDYCIDAGAHGITVLGLVTEVHKMQTTERLELVGMVGEFIAGRVPYAVTVGELTVEAQVDFARQSRAAGADWVILQPPSHPAGMTETELLRFFGSVADVLDIPVAVQNNPVNLSVSLSPDALVTLNRNHANISLLKGEGFSVDIARVIEGTKGAMNVFGGHGGIEFMSLLRSGGVGLIPAPDFLKPQVAIFELWKRGTPSAQEEAERIHREILPAIVFMSRSVPGLLCYGKRLFALQAEFGEPVDRAPALQPTEFGLSEVVRFCKEIRSATARL
jgi:2-keto-3-deoxy-L-arabinonate dehydratase